MNKAVFLDKDGTINVDKGYVYKIEDFEFIRSLDEASALAFAKSESFAEVARNLLSMNIPIEIIAKATKLTIDEIKKLQDDNKNTNLNK